MLGLDRTVSASTTRLDDRAGSATDFEEEFV
jgi:hypothetical protein